MLPYGCKKSAIVALFPSANVSSYLEYGQLYVNNLKLSKIDDDCTACVVQMEQITLQTLEKSFKDIQSIMSISGRINAFFSKRIDQPAKIPEWIAELKKLNVVGLSVQKSNRDPHMPWYTISGILKCPNPFIKDYTSLDKLPTEWKTHNTQDVTNYNKIATLYKLSKLKETIYATV